MSAVQEQVAEIQRDWIGRTRTREQYLDPESLHRFAAAVGATTDDVLRLPMMHWAWFNDVPADAQLGPDGHPGSGTFLPAVALLPRRMFASSRLCLATPLRTGDGAREETRIESVSYKSGRSGDLVFIEITRRIEQHGHIQIEERQTIVLRAAGDGKAVSLPNIATDAHVAPDGGQLWCPAPVQLFRFSAVTFNAHRIHYDLPYATQVERYPAIIVHGPFTAVRLACLAARHGRLKNFSFRALQPLYCGQPVRLVRKGPGGVAAIRCDGETAMQADATFA